MKKSYYLIGLPLCFILLVASTFLIQKKYTSEFVIVKESENGIRYGSTMSIDQNSNYDLGLYRTGNVFNNMYSYKEVLQSDQFIRPLLDMNVRTLDGKFDGTYYDYCTKYLKKSTKKSLISQLMEKRQASMIQLDNQPIVVCWDSTAQEKIGKNLKKAIKVSVDYETDFVSISCTSNDPLVSTMMANAIRERLLAYIEKYQQDKMQNALNQLSYLTEQAKQAYEIEQTTEKKQIYDSFRKQEVVYKAQMLHSPAFTTLSEPSFSYRKVSPSRWKMPLILTLLLGIGFWCWDNRKQLVKYI